MARIVPSRIIEVTPLQVVDNLRNGDKIYIFNENTNSWIAPSKRISESNIDFSAVYGVRIDFENKEK